MVQKKRKRTLITALAVLLVLLVAVGTIAFIRVMGIGKEDPYLADDTSTIETPETTAPDQKPAVEDDPATETTEEDEEEVKLDPASVGTIAIAPMEITVSYVKGVGGFEYEVMRTSNGTRYVEFSSAELVGTKCTNDKGTFASILASPNDTEGATISKTTTVDGEEYGLSLEGSTCTSNASKLEDYQKSFSDAFSLLKKLN